jgi:hypothetical protein
MAYEDTSIYKTGKEKFQDRPSVSGIQVINEKNLAVFQRCYRSLTWAGVLHKLGSFGFSRYWEIFSQG